MSIELSNEYGYLSFSNTGWTFILSLACEYGWEPQGTELGVAGEVPSDWDGRYGSSDGQTVTAADARGIANALDAAVADANLASAASRLEAECRQNLVEQYGPEFAAHYNGGGLGDPTEARKTLQDLVDFCRDGAFQIE